MFRNGFYSDKAVIALIPKNASTAISAYCAWAPTDYTAVNRRNYIAVIRDPVDRWISGATEFLWRSQKFDGEDITSFNLDRIHLDKHTQPQFTFLDNIDTKRTILYSFNSTLLTRMQEDWKCFRKTANLDVINTIDTDPTKVAVRDYVVSNANFDKVADFYRKDFHLYQKSLG